jgi:tRNA-specific 2-thiouridylase
MADTEKIIVAMSGGVDSSVAAALLREQGHCVEGLTMILPRYGPDGCERLGSEDTIAYAQLVAQRIGIPLRVLDMRRTFTETVLDYFQRDYAEGRTPNPCVRCNEWIKFGALQDEAAARGADALATGHYVRRVHDPRTGSWMLAAGPAETDQSYFLAGLSSAQIERARFPVGGMSKDAVREKARRLDLPVHDKGDSQDLCFLPAGGYRNYLRERCPDAFRPGPVLHVSGRELGRHEGLPAYTIGQRRGLGIAWHEPLYVVGSRPGDNALLVGERRHLQCRRLTVGRTNWLPDEPGEPLDLRVQIRYNHSGAEATVHPLEDGRVRVDFREPQLAPCPGQAAAFYEGDRVRGGGTIEETESTEDDE